MVSGVYRCAQSFIVCVRVCVKNLSQYSEQRTVLQSFGQGMARSNGLRAPLFAVPRTVAIPYKDVSLCM